MISSVTAGVIEKKVRKQTKSKTENKCLNFSFLSWYCFFWPNILSPHFDTFLFSFFFSKNNLAFLHLCRDTDADQKLQDLVNKTMWRKCCFSGDGEYVCAGSARTHALYIWEKSMGNLVKILHGTKGETLLDVVVSTSLPSMVQRWLWCN